MYLVYVLFVLILILQFLVSHISRNLGLKQIIPQKVEPVIFNKMFIIFEITLFFISIFINKKLIDLNLFSLFIPMLISCIILLLANKDDHQLSKSLKLTFTFILVLIILYERINSLQRYYILELRSLFVLIPLLLVSIRHIIICRNKIKNKLYRRVIISFLLITLLFVFNEFINDFRNSYTFLSFFNNVNFIVSGVDVSRKIVIFLSGISIFNFFISLHLCKKNSLSIFSNLIILIAIYFLSLNTIQFSYHYSNPSYQITIDISNIIFIFIFYLIYMFGIFKMAQNVISEKKEKDININGLINKTKLIFAKINLLLIPIMYFLIISCTILIFANMYEVINAFTDSGIPNIIRYTDGLYYNNQFYPNNTLVTGWDYIYFSCVTFFTVGYGDIIPIGKALKQLTTLEMVIGYILNVTFIPLLVSYYWSLIQNLLNAKRG